MKFTILALTLFAWPASFAMLPGHGPNKGALSQQAAATSGGGGGGGGGSCTGTIMSSTTFTMAGSGDVEANTSTNETGGTWSDVDAFGIARMYVDKSNDVAKSTTTATTISVPTETMTCYDYKVELLARTGSTGTNRIGPLARYNKATDQGYEFRITGAGAAEIRRRDSTSSQTLLSSTTVTAVVGSFGATTDYTLRFEVEDSSGSLRAYINGIPATTAVDTTYLTGTPGIFITNTGPRGDNFVVTGL